MKIVTSKCIGLPSAIGLLFGGIVVFTLCNVFLFPIHYRDLNRERMFLIEELFSEQVFVEDQRETDNKSSIFYLVETNSENFFLIKAERSIMFDRYRLYSPLELPVGETHITSDYSRKIFVSHEDKRLILHSQEQRPKSFFVMFVWLFVVFTNIIVAIMNQVVLMKKL